MSDRSVLAMLRDASSSARRSDLAVEDLELLRVELAPSEIPCLLFVHVLEVSIVSVRMNCLCVKTLRGKGDQLGSRERRKARNQAN